MSAEALECGVCLALPEGVVHQCNEGHCYCADCWNRLDPRRCPECRQPVPQANRNRTAERAIAALEASCEHCGEATTRGAIAAHLRVCPQRPNFCAAAAAGCRWAGLAAEQAAHEAACPFAICLRVVAPLQMECQKLKAQNEQLRGRVRALEGNEESGRRQRQRVGPAPHDAPPSDAEVEEMELAEAVTALCAHMAVARVAKKASKRLSDLCGPQGSEQAAAEAGVIEAVVEAMRALRQEEVVQAHSCRALSNVCAGDDAAAAARKQKAAAGGAIEEMVAALWAHPQVAKVQVHGCCALANVCWGDDDAAESRRQRAAMAGGLEEVVAAMQAHPEEENVQEEGCRALSNMCWGGAGVHTRRGRATQAGGLTVAVAAMQAHLQSHEVQIFGRQLLDCLPAGV